MEAGQDLNSRRRSPAVVGELESSEDNGGGGMVEARAPLVKASRVGRSGLAGRGRLGGDIGGVGRDAEERRRRCFVVGGLKEDDAAESAAGGGAAKVRQRDGPRTGLTVGPAAATKPSRGALAWSGGWCGEGEG